MELPKSTESISISVPTWLLEEVDAYAYRSDWNRSALFVRAIRQYLLTKMDSPALWEQFYKSRQDKYC